MADLPGCTLIKDREVKHRKVTQKSPFMIVPQSGVNPMPEMRLRIRQHIVLVSALFCLSNGLLWWLEASFMLQQAEAGDCLLVSAASKVI